MKELLRESFRAAFAQFLEQETDNILNGTSERNLCAHLAPLLQQAAAAAGFAGYRTDVEYNRNQGGRVKTILDGEMREVRITCDLILHSRGKNSAKDNLIAIEMKRLEHPQSEESYDDIWSADGVALPEHVCGYELGYFAELDHGARIFRFEEYQRGNLVDRFNIEF